VKYTQSVKIVINTNYKSAGTKVCVDDLIPRLKKAGHQVTRNDWHNYHNYDLVLFMSPDAEPLKAKHQNPRIKCGIMVPMIDYPHLQVNVRTTDFLLVGSIEARDEQLKYNSHIFIYYHFPDLKPQTKHHSDKSPIIIGYHGNLQHLISFHPNINHALDLLSKHYDLELWAIYNIARHGLWKKHLPKNIPVRHVQWTPHVYHTHLAKCDIGIVNNTIPISNDFRHLITQPLTRYLKWQIHSYHAHDTTIRFKYATNPGRIYPFAQLGIPVIADFAPSMNQFVKNNHSGLIAHSAAGWYHTLEKLITSPQLRQTYSRNLRYHIDHNYSINQNFVELNNYLLRMCKK